MDFFTLVLGQRTAVSLLKFPTAKSLLNAASAGLALGVVLSSAGCAQLAWRTSFPAPVPQEPVEAIAEEFWSLSSSRRARWASELGDPRTAADLPDSGAEAARAAAVSLRELRQRLMALNLGYVTGSSLDLAAHLLAAIDESLSEETCALPLWQLDPFAGPHTLPLWMAQVQPVDGPAAAASYLMRLDAFASWLQEAGNALEAGQAARFRAPQALVAAVSEQLAIWAAAPPLLAPQPLPTSPPPVSPAAVAAGGRADRSLPTWQESMAADLKARSLPVVRAAWARYAAAVQSLGAGPKDADAATASGSHVVACYRARLRHHAGGRDDVVALQEVAQKELERLQLQLGRLEAELPPPPPPASASSPALQQVAVGGQMRAAAARLLLAYGPLPALEARPAAEGGLAARPGYIAADLEGLRPARLWLDAARNFGHDEAGLAAWAAREGLPGRHLQAQLARSGSAQRLVWAWPQPLMAEGWAAYAQGWAAEVAMLPGGAQAERAVLRAHAHDAALAMVDGGLHVLRWRLVEAEAFLVENLALDPALAHRRALEVMATPGAAWAPLLGRLEILSLRQEAQRRLGPHFDLDVFHHQILAAGALPMPLVRQRLRAWLTGPADLRN